MSKRHPSGRLFRKLHRYGGLVSALLIIVICSTGILLNHTDELALSRQTIRTGWVLDWYGIELPAARSFGSGTVTATQLDRQLYAGSEPIPGSYAALRGIVSTAAGLVIATDSQLAVLTADGSYIETLDALYGVPVNIRRIGTDPDGQVIVENDAGIWRTTGILDDWQPAGAAAVTWSLPAKLPGATQTAIEAHFRGNGLTLERVILDIHAGRIFGSAGPWLADAIAILFILLAMTGIWMWARTRPRKA